GSVAAPPRHRERHACGDVVDQHRLNFLPPAAGHAKDRRETDRTGEAVYDSVLRSVHERRPEDRVSQPGLPDRALRAAFGAKTGMGAVLIGGGAADVDKLL